MLGTLIFQHWIDQIFTKFSSEDLICILKKGDKSQYAVLSISQNVCREGSIVMLGLCGDSHLCYIIVLLLSFSHLCR